MSIHERLGRRGNQLALAPTKRTTNNDGFFKRCSCALLLLGIASVLVACGGGGGGSPQVGASVICGSAAVPGAGIPGSPGTTTLTWDSAGPNSKYRIYYGPAPGVYLQCRGAGLYVGNVTTFTLGGLNSGTRYYFAVTSFDTTSNTESAFSNETSEQVI